MFQSFDETASPEQGPARLQALRSEMATEKLDGFVIPRADLYQGEYVSDRDARLSWLTGFTGSAGFCAALTDVAGVFVDGRYRTQVKAQVDLGSFTPVDWPEQQLGPWLVAQLTKGAKVGIDPWLHTASEVERLSKTLAPADIKLVAIDNLIDRIWIDQPDAPCGKVMIFPDDIAGESHAAKRHRMGTDIAKAGAACAVLTQPDSIAWLLNIRGSDIQRNPVPHCTAILHTDGQVDLFIDAAKLTDAVVAHLGATIQIQPFAQFEKALAQLSSPVLLDKQSVPEQVARILAAAGSDIIWENDPCLMPKAQKNKAEIAATEAAHLTDAAAVCEFLAWFDARNKTELTEIDLVTELETHRRATNQLKDISFDTIAGTGPNGAIMHYRVTNATNAPLKDGQIIVLDSGGQYENGTTDITRTLPVGHVGDEEKTCFTRVLQGMIGISRLRFPKGLAGRDIDALARAPLWMAGQDFNHGTGHGVGVYLCVHEGPQRISRVSEVPLKPGMILSNEPGYYREGAFGIRIENLIVVEDAPTLDGADDRAMYSFKNLTWVPIDLDLINTEMLSKAEIDWINNYHSTCRDKIRPRLSPDAQVWIDKATRLL